MTASSEDQAVFEQVAPHSLRVSGGRPLTGEVEVHGSKKSLPKIIIASLLTDEPCRVDGVAWIDDVAVASGLAQALGRNVSRSGARQLVVAGMYAPSPTLKEDLSAIAGRSRVPILGAGPQLARCGEAWIPPLGGDRIGTRSIEAHLELLRSLGADVSSCDGWLHITARGLRAARIDLPFPMVGVTEQALLAASLASGETRLSNAAVDPEVAELAAVLREMGASIEIDVGKRAIAIRGVEKLGGFDHLTKPDRIEAGSWASAALATGGEIVVRGASAEGMESFLDHYRLTGGEVAPMSDGIRFTGATGRAGTIRIDTGAYPAFESDWQSPMLVALTQVAAGSVVHETVFEERFSAVASLREMGADVHLQADCGWAREDRCRIGVTNSPHVAVVNGPSPLRGVRAHMPDLRSGFALTLAALAARGESVLIGAEVLHRGYECLTQRLQSLGGVVDVTD